MEFELDVTSLQSGGFTEGPLMVNIEARIRTSPANGTRPKFLLSVPLKAAIDLEVLG